MAAKWTVVVSDPYGEGPFAVLGPYENDEATSVAKELRARGLSEDFPVDIVAVWTADQVHHQCVPKTCDICDSEDNGDIVDGLCDQCSSSTRMTDSEECSCSSRDLLAYGCKCGGK